MASNTAISAQRCSVSKIILFRYLATRTEHNKPKLSVNGGACKEKVVSSFLDILFSQGLKFEDAATDRLEVSVPHVMKVTVG